MRQVTNTKLFSHPKYPCGVWVVDFDDHSRIAVEGLRITFRMMLGKMVSCGVPLAEREPDHPEKAPLQSFRFWCAELVL